jgi:hypothetical protein
MQCRDCSAQVLWWLQTEIEAIRDDIAPTWLQPPLSLQQTADKFVRPSLQQVGDVNQHQTVCMWPLMRLLSQRLWATPCMITLHKSQSWTMPAKVASGRHVALVTPADLYAGVSKQLVPRHHILLSTNLLLSLTCSSHHYQPLWRLRTQAIVLCQRCCCASNGWQKHVSNA